MTATHFELWHVFEMIVIARSAKRAVAIQLDCFVVPASRTPAMTEFEGTPKSPELTKRNVNRSSFPMAGEGSREKGEGRTHNPVLSPFSLLLSPAV